MKKLILFVLLGLAVIAAKAQTNYGYTYIGQRYEWLAGLFKALGLPAGDSARFQPGQYQRQGSVYMDTVNTSGSPNGFYIYEDPTGGNSPFWNRQTSNFQICQNRLLTPWNVSWQGTGYNFTVHGGQPTGQGSYQIGCSFYTEDSLTVTLSPSDATLERIDVIYLDATGIHVREGDLAGVGLAQKPSVTLDEIELTFITVSPGTTEPTLTQLIVWNENTESTVTNIGTTTDPNNLTNVFVGLKSVNVTNVNHNDIIDFEKLPGGSAWQTLGYDALVMAIKLKPTMPINTSCNIAVSLVINNAVVGTEVIVPITKSNSSTYQQVSIPMSAFGNLNNTLITKVRVRYLFPTAAANVYSGFYLDYIYFVDGLNNPQTPGPAQFTLNMPIGFTVNPTNTQQSPGTWTVTNQAAAAGQYYTKEGWVTLPQFVNSIGLLDGQAKDADGGSILGNVFYFQLADTTYPGLLSPELYRKISRNDSVTNGTPGDTLLVKLNDTTLLVKSLIAGTNISFDVGADSIVINATGGAGNPGEGITVTGDSIHLGGLIGAPATPFSQNRLINTNRKGLYIVNGTISDLVDPGGISWEFGQEVHSPVQIISRDTVNANDIDPPSAAVPWSGLYARRQLYYPTGVFRTQKVFGHQFEMAWQFDDTLSLRTEKGDYDAGFSIKNIYDPYGGGRQGIRASHGTGQNNSIAYAPPALLVTNILRDGNTAGNWIKVDGHLSGISSYLTMGYVNPDTIKAYVYYTTNGFISASSNIQRSYDFAPASYFATPIIDSAFGWFDTARVKYQYFAGKTVLGPSRGTANTWTSSDWLKVLGNVAITDSLRLGKATNVNDTTGYDLITRKRTDGSIFAIRADQLGTFLGGGGCSCTLAQTLTNDNVSGNQNIFMEGAASQLVFDYINSGGYTHGITFRSGTSIGAATEVYVSGSTAQDSSLRLQANAGSLIAADLNLGKLTTERNFYFPDASGTIALTSDIPAGSGVTTLAAVGASPNANAATISGTTLNLEIADASNFGVIKPSTGLSIASGVVTTAQRARLNTGITTTQGGPRINFIEGSGMTIGLSNASGDLDVTLTAAGSGTVNTGTANTLAYYPASTAAIDDLPAITANRALISDANGLPTHATTTATEIGYVNGVTSSIQTQLGTKASTALDNLASVAVNTTIASDADNTDDLGTSAKSWKDIYTRTTKYDGSTSGTVTVEAAATGQVLYGTNLDAQGNIPIEYDIYVRSDETLSASNADQPLFTDANHDVITVLANTTYEFEAAFDLTHGATSHDVQFGMIPTTASITILRGTALLIVTAVGTQTASQTMVRLNSTATTSLNAAGANATESVWLKGWFTVGATGGTIQPTLQFSSNPTGTVLLKAGSEFHLKVKGNNTFTEKGPFN